MAEESKKERLNRELMELLQELRVVIPGVQVLLAFLLTAPFQQRFAQLPGSMSNAFFASIACATLATAFLIAPSAHHRLLWRAGEKERLVRIGNQMAIVGTVFLAAAIVLALYVITDVLFTTNLAVLTAITALVVADLADVDLVEAGVGVLAEALQMPFRVGPAGDHLGQLLLGDQLRGLLEVAGQGQLLGQLAGHQGVGPQLEGGLAGGRLVPAPADLEPALLDTLAALGDVAVQSFLVGCGGDVAVADAGGQADRLGPQGRDQHRRRAVRQGVDAGVLDLIEAAVMADEAALPELAHDLHGLFEHLQAGVDPGPAVAEDVLVEVLAAADPEPEAALQGQGGGGRGLGEDGRVDADRGAGDPGGDREAGGGGDPADHRPHERALALVVVPGVVVVGDPHRPEAGLLGLLGLADQLGRAVLLAGQEVADLGHVVAPWVGGRCSGLRCRCRRPRRSGTRPGAAGRRRRGRAAGSAPRRPRGTRPAAPGGWRWRRAGAASRARTGPARRPSAATGGPGRASPATPAEDGGAR